MPNDWYTLRSLFDFSWRASRREFFLIQILGWVAICLPVMIFSPPLERYDEGGSIPLGNIIFGTLWFMLFAATLVAMLAVYVRRLHDQNKSGWWWFATWLPLIGWIFSLVFVFSSGYEGENVYGPDPRADPRPGRETMAALGEVFD